MTTRLLTIKICFNFIRQQEHISSCHGNFLPYFRVISKLTLAPSLPKGAFVYISKFEWLNLKTKKWI